MSVKQAAILLSVIFVSGKILPQSIKEGEPKTQVKRENKVREYEAQDFSHLIGIQGFSEKLLLDHFTLYQGYVQNANLLMRLLDSYLEGRPFDYQYQALKRRFGWEFDGMRLHEYYFGNLGGSERVDSKSFIYKVIGDQFRSFESWKKDFIATGMMRGIGWVILYFDPKAGRLFNTWINEHDLGHLAGGEPILVMDVWEHAYMPQYGLDRSAYIDAFFQNINWEVVTQRMKKSHVSSWDWYNFLRGEAGCRGLQN